MPTLRGWKLLGTGAVLLLLWIGFGERELLIAGSLLVGAVLIALVFTWVFFPQIRLTRKLYPAATHAGEHATVELSIRNQRWLPLLSARLSDRFGSLETIGFEISALLPRRSAEARYRIACQQRGVFQVGPGSVTVTDPFGLARLSRGAGLTDQIIIYPAVEVLSGIPVVRGRDPAIHASRPEFSHQGGEDFFTLREYQTGDDLRRVHWPSSARRDDLIIRQMESPWQSRALVLLDLRQTSYQDQDSFEQAVSGAASVVRHLNASGFDAELWAGGSETIPLEHYRTAMERLAQVRTLTHLDLTSVATRIGRSGRGGALFLVSGIPDHDLLGVHRVLSRDYGSTILLSVIPADTISLASFQQTGVTTVSVEPNGSWAQAWSTTQTQLWRGYSAV